MKQIVFILIVLITICSPAPAQNKDSGCLNISIISPELHYSNQIFIYKARTDKQDGGNKLHYVWTVQGGEILAGQGTDTAAIHRKAGDDGGLVQLEIKGLPKACPSKASVSFPFIDPPFPNYLDKYGKLTETEEGERLDQLLIALQNDPTATAVIRLQENKDLPQRMKFLNSYLSAKGFDKTRISLMVYGKNEQETEIWIVPAGAEMTDCDDCLIIKADDFEKLERIFRPTQ